MAINKVVYGNTTLIDLTDSTLSSADSLASGVTAYDRSGTKLTGTLVVDSTYSITKNLTDVSSSADDTKVIQGNSFFTELTPASGYVISSITVTMGGVDITDQVFKPGTGAKVITANGTYSAADDGLSGYTAVSVNVSGGVTPTGTKNISISSNGTTTEDVTNYATASISVNVPNSYSASDEGKVVSNGALVAQGSDTVTTNGTVDTTLISSLLVNVPTGGSAAKTKSGTFTGNGTRSVSITCDFEPDLVFWTTDAGTAAFSGTRHGIIARGLMAINRYSNNSTSITNAISAPYITDMNTDGSGYAMRATYESGNVTIYCFTSGSRSFFKNGQTYDYYFAKYTP